MFKQVLDNDIVFSNLPGFKPGDFCIYQLLSTTHNIFEGFDDGLQVRGVFLDISKAFDKVRHEEPICKLPVYKCK